MTVVISNIGRRHELNCFSPFCLHLCTRLQTLLFYLNEKRKVKTPSLVSKLPFRRRDSELIEIKESGIDGEEIRQEQRTHCPVEHKDFRFIRISFYYREKCIYYIIWYHDNYLVPCFVPSLTSYLSLNPVTQLYDQSPSHAKLFAIFLFLKVEAIC